MMQPMPAARPASLPSSRARWALVALAATLVALLTAAVGARAADRAATPRIVGGSPIAIADVPYQVALWNPTKGTPLQGQFCGGVIVAPTKVVTAGHCVDGQDDPPATIRVLAGTGHLRGATEPAYPSGVRDVAIAGAVVHPSYSPATADYDVAVITTAAPLYEGSPGPGSAIAPVPLIRSGQTGTVTATGAALRVSGWGDVSGNGDYPADLRATEVRVVDQGVCGLQFLLQGGVTPRMICATAQSQDSCSGDSGGPLTGDDGSGRVLAGLVSFGVGCANGLSSGVYTRISDAAISGFVRQQAGLPADGAPSTPAPAAPAPAAPAAAAADTVAPRAKVASHRCTRRRCTIAITVTDRLPTSGVARVTATMRWTVRRRCRRDGRRTTCPRARSARLRGTLVGGARWSIATPRLGTDARYRLRIVARDRAGNQQRTPARLSVRRKRG